MFLFKISYTHYRSNTKEHYSSLNLKLNQSQMHYVQFNLSPKIITVNDSITDSPILDSFSHWSHKAILFTVLHEYTYL